ncbi:hypothetical protein [Trinickia sp.]
MPTLTPEEIERIDQAYATSAIVSASAFLFLFGVAFLKGGHWLLVLIGG